MKYITDIDALSESDEFESEVISPLRTEYAWDDDDLDDELDDFEDDDFEDDDFEEDDGWEDDSDL
jgi:hypothetical protein